MKPITVLLAEDHTIVREGLRSLLNLELDIQVIGEAENGRRAVKMSSSLAPDVVVMDIAMPLLNGLEATRQILRNAPTTRILILSAYSDDAYVEQVMALGAFGFLVKQSTFHVLPEAIRDVHRGVRCFSPAITRRRHHLQTSTQENSTVSTSKNPLKLTSREMEVLQLIAEGKANKQTAEELHISIKTVEKHRQSLMEKLDIHDTASLTRHAITHGIIESDVRVTIL